MRLVDGMSDREKAWLRKWLEGQIRAGTAKVNDIQEVDFEAFYDSSLTYAENKVLFEDMFVVPMPRERDYLGAYVEYEEGINEEKAIMRRRGGFPELEEIKGKLDYDQRVWLSAYIDELEGAVCDMAGRVAELERLELEAIKYE
jgi:hypothetical protein